jgi:hypothetical protein
LSAPVVAVRAQTAPPPGPAVTTGPPPLMPLPILDNDDTPKDDANLAERLLVAPREPRCDDTGQIGGITVCGKKKDNSKNRLPITSDLNSATATADGMPRAPDVMGNRITGHSIKFGCIVCPKAMLPDIDFSLLPADPVGSDADRIGHGEIRGN